MKHPMRPVIASLLRERLPLPLVVLAVTLVGRLAVGDGEVGHSADLKDLVVAIVFLGLLPMLVIAMATGWLRGDALPWPWVLSRPVGRTRWLCSTAAIDLATVVTCVAVASWVLAPSALLHLGPLRSPDVRSLGYGTLLMMIYAAAAFAGSRRGSAIAGAIHALLLLLVVLGIAATSSIVEKLTGAAIGLHGGSITWMIRSATDFDDRSFLLPEISALSTLLISAAFVVIALLRTASRLPAPPQLRRLLPLVASATLLAGIAVPVIIVLLVATAI